MLQNKLGKFINQERNILFPDTSLNTFALDIGIEPATLSRIENLKQDVKFTTLNKIAKGFNLQTSEFIAKYEIWEKEN